MHSKTRIKTSAEKFSSRKTKVTLKRHIKKLDGVAMATTNSQNIWRKSLALMKEKELVKSFSCYEETP